MARTGTELPLLDWGSCNLHRDTDPDRPPYFTTSSIACHTIDRICFAPSPQEELAVIGGNRTRWKNKTRNMD